ncbi:alpha/beta fold hydrolase [Magnetospira sp. QH-2]|uniref:alpha/beta fold hydrolase n=1 Tax=Magnetospira sp. (strain QH-2) TaxID=1288970 RepID=UPI0003E80E11|nr:alpha/beta fold hydrolase [Magnetospira sp. QH-2]CCQ74254.1 Abhydrolase domain-containing protein 11; putative esterase [Magnetospira sp. QH-2]
MSLDLSHRTYGAGKPLILLHGLLGSKSNWAGVAKALSAHHQVHALDLRNHGQSPWSERMTYEDMADDVAAFIRHHHLLSCDLVGHSMGGKVAMMLALHHGELLDRLVVVDIAPASSGGDFHPIVEALAGVPLAECDNRDDVDDFLADEIPEASLRGFLLQNLTRTGDGLAWRVNLAALHLDMERIISFPDLHPHRVFNGRTLFLAGQQSDYVTPAHAGVIRRLFAHAVIDRVPNAGHWVHADQPKAFLDKLRHFLDT